MARRTPPSLMSFMSLCLVIAVSVLFNIVPNNKRVAFFVNGFSGLPLPSAPSSSSSWDTHASMKEFDDRLVLLERETAPASLQSFWEPQLCSFSVQPGASQRLSITSTCYALQAMMLASETPSALYGSFLVLDPSIVTDNNNSNADTTRTMSVQLILRALLRADWRRDDLFQVPVLLYTLLRVDPCRNFLTHNQNDEGLSVAAQEGHLQELTQAVLEARPRRRDGQQGQASYSDYIVFQCAQVYAQLYDGAVCSPPTDFGAVVDYTTTTSSRDSGNSGNQETQENATKATSNNPPRNSGMAGLPASALPAGAPAAVALALARCAETSYNTLCRELALRSAGDEFDVMRLAYSLLTYVVSTQRLANTNGRRLVLVQDGSSLPDSEPSVGTRIKPVNQKLVRAALAAFFEEQNDDGLWDKGQPIYRSFRKTGRNIGNAFIFAVDTVASLLEHLPAQSFRPHLSGLRRVLDWIEVHYKVEILPDYCDPETGQCTGRAIQGWSSPHLSQDSGPSAWCTAQTVSCISRMKTVVETLMHDDVLAEFRGINLSQKGPTTASWDRLLDADLGKCGLEQACTLKQVLEDRMITPRLMGEDESVLNESYSAILFGPPGTAKTTIAQSLAERLGYDFLVIDTAEFLADGLTSVASRIRYVFTRLQALRRCVILFDEIEEFCLNRESPGIGMESRMLTTAMLTAINDLRRTKKSIFFLATNRLRAFDAAITRPGRFDMQLFVGTPNLEARFIQFRQKLADVSVSSTTKEEAMETYRNFLSDVWDVDARYMNYAEGVKFAGACANVIAKGSNLTIKDMTDILKSQTAVMTVRGVVRDEFDASMDMTRL